MITIIAANKTSLKLNGCATSGLGSPLVKNKVVRIMTSSSEYTETNAWNQQPSSGQTNNNNNKANGYQVRPVVALSEGRVKGWIEAFNQCCSNKMTSEQCVLYRLHDTDLLRLMVECESYSYTPSTSICFCVTRPKLREIFAANFRDRIVQHWICMRIEPLFERRYAAMGDVTWNCRKGKGVRLAVNALRRDILDVSCNYTRRAYVGRFDVAAFFMNIDIRILERLAVAFVRKYYHEPDVDLLVYLLTVTIRHRPQNNCTKRGDPRLWPMLPAGKTLFLQPNYRGMPIGNITSQLLAGFYMSFLDEYMVGLCKSVDARYERFVDDFAVVCRRKADVLMMRDKAGAFLQRKLNLQLHHDKQYIQDVTHGVYFVGSVIKMERVYISNRTVAGFIEKLKELDAYLAGIKRFGVDEAYVLDHYLMSLNSYMGFFIDKATYALRRRAVKRYCPRLFDYYVVKGHFEVFKVKSKYSISNLLLIQDVYG